ncbi:arf-GAP with Rho-GAP domain, ANK repeat and PH domain-containing protein 1-like isoform X4 [Lytechinus variegatus]|uniref:arf-GAP with Rho-GAP domain, ANK repeat and PH domain-containing protein 1-like isoform X4 n=1 Tax=Lytechinus variegatus TaxID=7654 RepID=UPI001BB0FC14|nr:arf-GAP with Rho-GAP domain, ANK repeat and PH domain-containing protein 1-like isoform X4 [Lytechinus variegatus]
MAGSGNGPASVQEWLQSLHLNQFLNDFLFSGYTDLSKCCHITEADLVRLGITQVGYQKRILSRLPSEANLIVMEFSGQNSNTNGSVLGQPKPSPRKEKKPVIMKPSIDKTEYMELTPQMGLSSEDIPKKSTPTCMLNDSFRSKSDNELLGPRSQKPVPKPRVKQGTGKRNNPPPLPERGKPVPQPRAPPPVPPQVLPQGPLPPQVSSLSSSQVDPDAAIASQPQEEAKAIHGVEVVSTVSTNPFSAIDEPDDLDQFDPLITSPFNPFNDSKLVTSDVPLPSAATVTHDGPESKLGLDLSTRPVPPPPPVRSDPPNFPVDDLLHRPVPQPPEVSSFKGGDLRSVPQPPEVTSFKGEDQRPVPQPSEVISIKGEEQRPVSRTPDVTSFKGGDQRPVPQPPEVTSSKVKDSDAQGEFSPPPPLPGKKLRHPRSVSEPKNLNEFLKTRNPPPPLPPGIAEEGSVQLPPLPPRPIPTSEVAPSVPAISLMDDTISSIADLEMLDQWMNDTTEVNANIDSKDLNESMSVDNSLVKSNTSRDGSSPSIDSNRKSDHSSRSSQDDTHMVSATHWPDSDHSDVPFNGVSLNPNSTLSSIASTDSEKIISILDDYRQSGDMTQSQESVPSPDTSLNQEDSTEDSTNLNTSVDNESLYGAIWEPESRPLPQVHSVQYRNPPPAGESSEDATYLPLMQCVTGDARPLSTIEGGMPEGPPPPIPTSAARPLPPTPERHSQGTTDPDMPEGPPPPVPTSARPVLPASAAQPGISSSIDNDMPVGPPPPVPTLAARALPQALGVPAGPSISVDQGMPEYSPPPLPSSVARPAPPLPGTNIPLPPSSSPPPLPVRRAPPAPPVRIDSQKFDKPSPSHSSEDILMQLGDDHMKEAEDGYDFLEHFPKSSSQSSLPEEDDVIVIDFQEDDIDTDEEDNFHITIPDGARSIDSGISSTGAVDDTFDRKSSYYASIRQSDRPYQRKVPEEARRRLSMRLSTRGNIPVYDSNGLRRKSIMAKLEKSGYLWKCGQGRQGKGGFRKRWFVFNGKELRYYENERTMTTCKGIIPVGTMLNVKHIYKPSIVDKKSRIELDTNAKTYYLATDNGDEGTIWANILMQAIIAFQSANNNSYGGMPPPGGFPKGGDMSCPDKQGYLKMEGCNHKRYVAIKGEMLCYYASERDFEAAVPVSDIQMMLANARVNPQKPDKIVLTTPSTTHNFTAESPEEAKEWVNAMMNAVSEGLSDKLYLHKAWENESNKYCADCSMPDPDWCSLNFGIVICKNCSGIHRDLGVHVSKVRSLKMDVKAFTDSALEVFLAVGNRMSNGFWEEKLDRADGVKPMPDDSIAQRKLFIEKKYRDRQYCEQILWEKETLNKEFLRAVENGELMDCLRFIFSGANVDAVHENGKTAKEICYGHDNSLVIRELLEQNKPYSQHQQEVMTQEAYSTVDSESSPQQLQGQQQQKGEDPQGSPVPLPRRKTLEQGGRNGSPTLPARRAPPPPTQAAPPSEELLSSVGSIQEQIRKAGYLYKTGSNRRDFLRRYCVLEHGTFSYYQDDKANQAAKNTIEGTEIVFVAKSASKQGHDYCFEIGTTTGRLFLFAAEDEADRKNWMHSLVKFHTPECMWRDCEDYEYAGFLRKKIGRSSTTWHRLWFLLKGKLLSFYSAEKDGMEIIDLRKAKEISQDHEEESSEQVKDIAIVIEGRTIYLRADKQQISDAWMLALQKNSSQIGPELEDQLLTEGHIPHIIKECIEFVYIHEGLEQQGIYRLSGTASKIQKVREMFRMNPKSVRISRDDFEVNDVTGALKKYFRELPDPVLTKEYYSKWIEVSDYTDHAIKLEWYKHLLGCLPKVHYYTLKAIIAHLIRVKEKERINKMTEKNLASVFGPTLMALPDSSYGNAEKEIAVIGDLMTYFMWLFDVDDKEWADEEKKIKKLTEMHRLIKGPPKQSNAIVMPFYIRHKNEGNSITLPLQENTTAKEVVESVVKKHNLPTLDGKPWGLFEVIDNEQLERMLFDYEVVLSEVGAWDPSAAASNYLCIKQNSLLHNMEVFLKNVTSSSSIKYADSSKKFKEYYFEISANIMRFSKVNNKSGGSPISYWDIIPLKIYMGIGTKYKKTAPTRWGITFHSPGEKDYKCLCFDQESVRTMWLAGLFRCKLAGAAAYTSNLRLQELKGSPLSQFEHAPSVRDRTSSFGVLRDNIKLKVPWKRHNSITD